MCDYEGIRQRYKPSKVTRLLIGESRPENGTFFYLGDSNLYRFTKEAFEELYGVSFSLESFMSEGYWLYDVCSIPVNGIENRSLRRQHIIEGIQSLHEIIGELKPEIIICVKKGDFRDITRDVIIKLGYIEHQNLFYLSFPACGRQREYKTELINILRDPIKVRRQVI